MSELKFYEPKLKTNSVKFCFWILTCSIFSFVISYFYGVFSIIPYVFIKITVVIFFSLILGLFVRYSSKKFHILSAKIVQYSGTFFILLTLYFSWNSFFLFLDYRTDSFFRYFFKPIQFANPESLFEYFRLLNSSSKISLNNPNNYNIV